MAAKKKRPTDEQHVAVFGGSGSGKTVLLSAFYGIAQEPDFGRNNGFTILARNAGQGTRLHSNYLGMRDQSKVPSATNLLTTAPYAFDISIEKANRAGSSTLLTLVWHDYPGEWFEQETQSASEAQRKIEVVNDLLSADVALLLLDGAKMADNAGEEGRYLKLLFSQIANELKRLKDELTRNGEIMQFPRIWVLALSKADLFPGKDTIWLRDTVIGQAGGELENLRQVIASIVKVDDALSIGEDFVMLSSAKFEPGRIQTDKRIGLDLLLPLAAILPLERHVHWTKALNLPVKFACTWVPRLATVISNIAPFITRIPKIGPPLAGLGALLNMNQTQLAAVLDRLNKVGESKLGQQAQEEWLIASLKMRLLKAMDERRLLLSQR